MNRLKKFSCAFFVVFSFFASSCDNSRSKKKAAVRPIVDFRTNQQYIEGLNQDDINFTNDKDVFYNLLASMDKSVMVYPSEHYYYFQMNYKGSPVSGTILLKETYIDSGKITFGYMEKYPKEFSMNASNAISGSGTYTEQDSVYVTRKNDSLCTVSYRDVSVDFHFYMPGIQPSEKAKFLPSEKPLCNGMDESGIRHTLIYNEVVNRMYWILNDDEFVPETFKDYTDGILIGKRTQFAYYNDSIMNRKILIGVAVENVLNNNWFDGPFDQVPDVYIKQGKLDMKKYIDKIYGFSSDKIDNYLNYINGTGRVAVNNYTCYDDLRELYTLLVAAKNMAGSDRNKFYSYITTTHYEVPERYMTQINNR